MDLEKLRVLEKQIEEILRQHAQVRAERDHLKQKLSEAESHARSVGAQLDQHRKDRAEIRARVERMLSRLEGMAAP